MYVQVCMYYVCNMYVYNLDLSNQHKACKFSTVSLIKVQSIIATEAKNMTMKLCNILSNK